MWSGSPKDGPGGNKFSEKIFKGLLLRLMSGALEV
jgi:hypothetical protein